MTDETYPSAVAPGVADTASPQPSATSPYLTTAEAAAYLRVSKSYLDKARVYGNGPRFVRLGERKVVYHITDLDAWAWLRLDKSAWWLVPGIFSLIAFAFLLTRIDTLFAGRAYAAYGGIYIVSSLLWLWAVEGQRPDRWDVAGGAICLVGAAVILFGPRSV